MALVVLDGWGLASDVNGNAVARARTPNMDRWTATYPSTCLGCAGEDVGLAAGQMGNSNVGHLNLGAGRVVYQDLARINRAASRGDLARNPVLLKVLRHVAEGSPARALHFMGLLSPGGVHSHQEHLYILLRIAREHGLRDVWAHAFLDGRDVPPRSALAYVAALEEVMTSVGRGKIATVCGRYYAMDRDRHWDRVERAYLALTVGAGLVAPTAAAAIEAAYARGESDEFVQPTVIGDHEAALPERPGTIRGGDGVIFFNFRADRARQLTHAFTRRNFDGFERPGGRLNLEFAAMTSYDDTLTVPVFFPPERLTGTLGEAVSRAGLRQLRLAETEKYAHVTYFFSGGEETPLPGEDRVLIPSPKVATYDLKPEMSAPEVAAEAARRVAGGEYDLMVINFANADMVGHTGDYRAAVRAVEAVDGAAGRVVEAVIAAGGAALVVSDHGNAERMVDETTGQAQTAHTTFPVPFILVDPGWKAEGMRLRPGGNLGDVAPTILEIMGLEKPPEMTGVSLLI